MYTYNCDCCGSDFEITDETFVGQLTGIDFCTTNTKIQKLCSNCYSTYKETSFLHATGLRFHTNYFID